MITCNQLPWHNHGVGSPLIDYFDALVLHETRLWAMVEQRVRSSPGTVSLARFEVLRTIGRTGAECRVQDVADALVITVGAASRIVDRIVGDGLVTRSPHTRDRRSVCLELTDDGQRALDATGTALERALSVLLDGLDPHAIDSLTAALRTVDEQLTSGTRAAVS
jgi:DNA-binding MarR family transcriptional regulator